MNTIFKKIATYLLVFIFSGIAFSQQLKPANKELVLQKEKPVFNQQEGQIIRPIEIPMIFNGTTGNLRDYVEPKGTVNERTKSTGKQRDWPTNFDEFNQNHETGDGALQKAYPAPNFNKALDYSWDGIAYTGVNPADPTVDVGPNHVVQMINGTSGSLIRVYSKTGTPIGSQVYFDNSMGMPSGAGDPIVMYDERADRWVLTEFSSTGNNLHIAISTTPDPSGSYNTFVVNSPSGFPDYPKYSIWNDMYIITANIGGNDIWVLDRTSMLAGGATNVQLFSQSNFGTIAFQAATPVSLAGTTEAPTNAPGMVMRVRDNAWAGSSSDALEIWELDIDFANSSNSSFSLTDVLPIAQFDSDLCGYTTFNCIPQPGTSQTIDPLRELLMNRIFYRNFGTHESIVCCHVTDVDGTDHAGIRWYELRRTGGLSGNWSIYQEATYSPDNDNRFMGSIGISESGNIGLMFNVSSGSTFPSIRYTGRKECDPLGQMTEPETIIVAGNGSQGTGTGGRYGDYNQLGVDPADGETFYCTAMYNPSAQWATRIGAFSIAPCVVNPEVEFDITAVTVNEGDADVANGCLDYVVVDIPITIGVSPSQNADITITVTGGTATQGVDFDLVSSSFTLSGSTLTGTAQLHIYNDNYVEGTETIELGYTLNPNGGDAYSGPSNQAVTVTIEDNDLNPASMINTVVVWSHDFESGLAPVITVNNAGGPQNDPFAVGDAAAASSTAFTVPNTNATQMAWINDDACNCNQNNVDLTMPSVDLTGYTGASLTFASYYENNNYQGNQEVAIVEVSVNGGPFNTVYTVPNSNWSTLSVDLSAYVGNNDVVVNFNYSDGTGWLYGWAIDDVVIYGDGPIAVQTAINTGSGMTGNLGPNGTVHFYDAATSKVMMSIENTSSWDYGCVTVEVDRSGTSATEFNIANPTNYLHDKTFTIVPTNNNPTGSYTVTLFYEEAEVAGWESATGNSRNNAEVIKVAGSNAIGDVTPANAGSFTIVNNVATIGSFNSDVTFTASFNSGFSGFGVGVYNAGNLPPVASFDAPAVCQGTAMSFADVSTNVPTSWSWDFGDGTGTSNLQNPSYTYATGGNYNVTLTATNAFGSDTYAQSVTVNALPVVVASATNNNICLGSSSDLSVTGATSYLWDNGLGSSDNVTVSPTTTTSYIVVGTDANNCENTDVVTITVNQLPVITTTGSTNPSTCATTTGSITIGSSGTGNISWSGPLNGSDNSITLPYTAGSLSAGVYVFNFTDLNGCASNPLSVQLTDPNAPAPPSIVEGSLVGICSGGTATLTSSYASGNTWSTNEISQSITVNSAGQYSVFYTDGSGCVSSTTNVDVSEYTPPTITTSGNTSICLGSSTILTALGASSYSWDNGAGAGSSVTVAPTTTTTYTVTGTDLNGCVGETQVTVTVVSAPVITASADLDLCQGSSATLTAIGASTYVWNNGAGSGSSVTVSPNGTTTYIVTGTDGNGCQGTDEVVVTVFPLPSVNISPAAIDTICINNSQPISLVGSPTGGTFTGPGVSGNIFTPATAGVGVHTISYSYTDANGCVGTNSVLAVVQECLDLEENLLNDVVLSPNPNDGNFTILGLDIHSEYSILDAAGRLVLKGVASSSAEGVQLTNLQAGSYYLHGYANAKYGIVKFIVVK